MSAREDALFEYVATIAFDPRVRAAKSAGALWDAVWACAKEDFPDVAKRVLRNGVRAIARPIADEVVGRVFQKIDGFLGRRR